ncbi:hypothetical protein LOK49_LG09G00647 [Camellia lanceoleosa]|uniref:Uncharacterized protein n=1 Tax=Camellia lanceoleosa TaxID=1840588 RepID=A0ACC0GFQ6_9ERIC|nr:hypothetical protein LOK49_LG09G00647 [Camellia lanceoleosa]
MMETVRDRPTASRRHNVILSQKVAKRPRRTRKTKDQGGGVNEHDMNDIGAAPTKTVEVENDGGNQFNVSDRGDDLGDEPIDMGDEPTDIGDDPGDELTDMGDYEDQPADTTEKVNEDLTGPFPGGPYNPSILKSFHCHVAAKIWHNDRIDSALSISHSMLKIGYNEVAPTRDMLRNAMKKITQVLEGQQSTEEHTPSENLVYTRRRKHGATS